MSIIPHSFYFRHSVSVPEIKVIPRKRGQLLKLPKSALIPDLNFKAKTDHWGEIRIGWNNNGLGISLKVKQKQHPTTDAEYFNVWIDTRDTKTIHRANRYCHFFQFRPVVNAPNQSQPGCTQLTINRAQADARQSDLSKIQLWSKIESTGYELEAWIPASELTGFDPGSYPQMGFYYTIFDSELGEQFMTVDQELPIGQDPSLWATMRLEA
ncbi:hypothetical protein Pan241w_30420 [Gimesia alba]|uniref:Carbohydrate-binding domain-containing protein n=1 Tax=Gimesia alba TaxID=2527973 RepID=A0A517RGD9_9PLAN|nr:hypothetical protein [Gimesia alba]QDT42947.1 hypothetical protein Pan241w_30420 [Gimesia alba]